MRGHFDLSMLHSPGLTRELLEAVRLEGGNPAVESYLRELSLEEAWHTDNIVLRTFPSYFFYRAMSAASVYGFDSGPNGWAGLALVQLATTAAEPSYTGDSYSVSIAAASLPDTPAGIVADTAWKRFVDGCVVAPDIKSDPSTPIAREAIYGKFKWLFLPGECTSDQIRSVVVYGSSYYNNLTSTYNKTRVARMRIKDSGGNPVTINKAASKSLLVEYTFTMPSF